ncbi:MAG: adenosylmethionine--8-amino-7-oxononanoate transaminase [Planctomycetaceae bacterium]
MTDDLRIADRVHHWHGFTQMSDYESLLIERADGCWLIDQDGRRLLDGVSSLWCNIHGHRHPRIDEAIREQLSRVAHVTNIGMGCTTPARLASRLAALAPGDLDHVFFSSDGASAVEVAIKMALQYWRQSGQPVGLQKHRYLALGSAYHGDTVGTVSLGDIAHFHRLFDPLLFQPLRGPCPDTYRLPAAVAPSDATEHYAAIFESLIQTHRDELAALVIEPLVQGAAGLVMHPRGLLRRLRELCDRYDVLMIADEVATGFGRTGKMFACEHEGVVPDLLCLGKGLTGGYLPMAATIASSKIFDAFLAPVADHRQFFHGHTYSGNPLSAAAALASLDVFDDEHVLEALPAKAEQLQHELAELREHPHVGDLRQLGMMVGIELVRDRATQQAFRPSDQVGRKVCQAAMTRGVWLRPLGDVIVLMPPLGISHDEIGLLTTVAKESIRCTLAHR